MQLLQVARSSVREVVIPAYPTPYLTLLLIALSAGSFTISPLLSKKLVLLILLISIVLANRCSLTD
jgi:hypothetical protein